MNNAIGFGFWDSVGSLTEFSNSQQQFMKKMLHVFTHSSLFMLYRNAQAFEPTPCRKILHLVEMHIGFALLKNYWNAQAFEPKKEKNLHLVAKSHGPFQSVFHGEQVFQV